MRVAGDPPCFLAAAHSTEVSEFDQVSPLVYCIWERYEAQSLNCRLSGYDLEAERFTQKMPNGENAIEVRGSCANGGIARLLKTKIKGRSARAMVQADARPYFWGQEEYLWEYFGAQKAGGRSATLVRPAPPVAANGAPAEGMKVPHTSVKVFFATDRKAGGSLGFTDERSENGEVQLGTAVVSVPFAHQIARLETPTIFSFEVKEDAAKHIVVQSVTKQDADVFARELKLKVASSPEQDAFVFIHGYNNTFNDSLRRAAQMAYDLNFQGAPIVYSWPSGDAVYKYSVAEANVDWTFRHLAKFLAGLPQMTGARKIHLIAHSMGNRALTNALTQLMMKSQTRLFNQIILAAPDIDSEVFGQIAEQVQQAGERVTIYASKNDEALQASQKFHNYVRLGQGGESIYATPYSDTIDASSLQSKALGHSYFGDDPTVLTDIGLLLMKGLAPTQRPPLIAQALKQSVYWKFGSAGAAK